MSALQDSNVVVKDEEEAMECFSSTLPETAGPMFDSFMVKKEEPTGDVKSDRPDEPMTADFEQLEKTGFEVVVCQSTTDVASAVEYSSYDPLANDGVSYPPLPPLSDTGAIEVLHSQTMAPLKKSVEEKKLAKRLREKARYERNMSDPVKATEVKNRKHANYMRRKEKEKPYSEKTDREKRSLKKKWREQKRTNRLMSKKNNHSDQPLDQQNDSDAPPHVEAPNDKEGSLTITLPCNTSHQFQSGQKRRERNKKRRQDEYILMKKQLVVKDVKIAELERKCDSLRKQLGRKNRKNTKSPRSLVNVIIKNKDARVVRNILNVL